MSLKSNKIAEMNLPLRCLNKQLLKTNNIYITTKFDLLACIEIVSGIYVDKDIPFTAEYFNTSIIGKDVYANLTSYGGYLPVTSPNPFIITEKGQAPFNGELDYKRILFQEETTIADLYRNACAYQYSPETDSYIRLPAAGAKQNALKYIMQKRITEIAGDPYDRIADLSRIILFLLSKITLSAEEHSIMSPLLAHAQSAVELADVFNREKNIQEYVAHVKSNPEAYLNE